jgi:hypothetical protein
MHHTYRLDAGQPAKSRDEIETSALTIYAAFIT